MKWYPRWLADYAGKTAGLSMIEHGAYTLLLDHYYQIERALPIDRESIYRICRAMEQTERQAVDRVIEQFFSNCDGALHNSKCDAVIATAREHAELQSRKGTAGAEKRWKKKRKVAEPQDAAPKPSRANGKHPIGDWKPTEDEMARIAERYKRTPAQMAAYFTELRDYCARTGSQYADYLAAYRTAVRGDWGGHAK